MASTAPTSGKSFHVLILEASAENDPSKLAQGFSLAPEQFLAHPTRGPQLLRNALCASISNAAPTSLAYLLDQRGAQFSDIRLNDVAQCENTDIWQVLIDRGWDVNQSAEWPGQPLLQMVLHRDDLVRWLLAHGAKVPQTMPEDVYQSCLLESAASHVSVDTFKILQDKGAPLGTRTLHFAASGGKSDMVRYLVEEVKCNVNAMDCPPGLKPGNFNGTPLNYAVKGPQDERQLGCVRLLLEKGADPRLKDVWGVGDAWKWAELEKNESVIRILNEWKRLNISEHPV